MQWLAAKTLTATSSLWFRHSHCPHSISHSLVHSRSHRFFCSKCVIGEIIFSALSPSQFQKTIQSVYCVFHSAVRCSIHLPFRLLANPYWKWHTALLLQQIPFPWLSALTLSLPLHLAAVEHQQQHNEHFIVADIWFFFLLVLGAAGVISLLHRNEMYFADILRLCEIFQLVSLPLHSIECRKNAYFRWEVEHADEGTDRVQIIGIASRNTKYLY